MANIMNPITKRAYKVEFETSNITIEELCRKYNITKEQLGSTEKWEKRATVVLANPICIEKRPNTIGKPAHSKGNKDIIVSGEPKTMLDTIQETKELALDSTKQFFENYNTDEVTTKEFKDMVGVLKDLEAGELLKEGKGQGTTVNILVQNLTERFRDDC